MTQRVVVSGVQFALGALVAGAWVGPAFAQSCETISGDGALHVAVEVQGHVNVRRKEWRGGVAPVMLGTTLHRGDFLEPEGSSGVKVVCADLTVGKVTRRDGVPCAVSKPVMRWIDGAAISPLRNFTTFLPMVISPRKTKLLNPHPTLRWRAVEGAPGYTIQVRGLNLSWETKVRSAEAMVYPRDAPPLKAGKSYKLIVVPTGRLPDDDDPGLGFTMLSAEESKMTGREEERIRRLGLPEAPTRLLVAHLYASHCLYAEAIQWLDDLPKDLNEPAPARLLGDLYVFTDLLQLGETRYLEALDFSRKLKDTEGEALAHRSLERIYRATGKKAQALEHLKRALALSKMLGDDKRVEELETKLKSSK